VVAEYGWGDNVARIAGSGYPVPPPGRFLMGSCGGRSAGRPEPGYQRGVVPDALEADAMQATGHPLGFVNPALYRLAARGALRDVRPVDPARPPVTAGIGGCGEEQPVPCLTTLGGDGALAVTPGYDAGTGIGTPAGGFVTAFRTG